METITTPAFSLTVDQLESHVKAWVKDVINGTPDPVKPTLPTYLTRQQVAEKLFLSLPTVDSYIRRGLLKARRVGDRILFAESDIEQSLKEIPARKKR